jgi:selenocysteine lyase/cysteine desulfurase
MAKTHPIQPLEIAADGVLRFKQNKIVNDLLNKATEAKIMDMNTIARDDYSREDREQFAQLIGYSHSGAGDLGYMSSEVLSAAFESYEAGATELESRNAYLRTKITDLKDGIRRAVAELFDIHPDDLR